MLSSFFGRFGKKKSKNQGLFGGDGTVNAMPLIEPMISEEGAEGHEEEQTFAPQVQKLVKNTAKDKGNKKQKGPKDFEEMDMSRNFEVDGKKEFAEIYGSALVGRKQNFLIVIFAMFIAGISLFYAMTIASNKVAIPWFVEVNKHTGELTKPVQITSLTPNQAVIQSQLAKFTEKCFVIDPKLSLVFQRECAQMATGKAVEQLRAFRIEHDIIARVRKGEDYRFAKAKSVDTTQKGVAFIHLATQDLLPDGTRSPEKSYRIRLDYKFIPPKDQLALIENPLGLFVSMFNPVLER